MLPGARLYIGPHGKPYESLGRGYLGSLGACCASCASGGPCSGAKRAAVGSVDSTTGLLLTLGAVALLGWVFRSK